MQGCEWWLHLQCCQRCRPPCPCHPYPHCPMWVTFDLIWSFDSIWWWSYMMIIWFYFFPRPFFSFLAHDLMMPPWPSLSYVSNLCFDLMTPHLPSLSSQSPDIIWWSCDGDRMMMVVWWWWSYDDDCMMMVVWWWSYDDDDAVPADDDLLLKHLITLIFRRIIG